MDSQLTLSLASSGVYSQGMLSPVTSAKRPELNAAAIGTKANPADRKRLVFVAMLAWIAFVSCFDIYCSFLTEEVLAESEENPIGRWLIALDGGSIHLFMKVKTAGTFLVLTLLYLLLVLRPTRLANARLGSLLIQPTLPLLGMSSRCRSKTQRQSKPTWLQILNACDRQDLPSYQ